MSDITPERINIQTEEVAYRAAVSESTFTRFGSSINFINDRQYDSKQFFVNGPYKTTTAIDGAALFLFDAEIVGCFMFNITAGSSGTTEFDIRRYTASNVNAGSIFSTKPSITSAAGNYAFVANRLIPSPSGLENPSGTTASAFAITQVNEGDMIVADLTQAQINGQNCGIVLYYRPR